jgi:AcrR family transcriptional regulator
MSDQKLDTGIRREQIAEAALGLLASQGLGRLSVAAVARRVGLVPSGIYRHFKNKDEMLEAVLSLLERRIDQIVQTAEQTTPDPVQRLRNMLMGHVRFIREGRAIPRMVFADEGAKVSHELRSRILDIFHGYVGHVAQFVAQGQQQGCIRAELDPQTVALMFFGIVVPAGILWHLTDGGFDVTKHAERAWPVFSEAIRVGSHVSPRAKART